MKCFAMSISPTAHSQFNPAYQPCRQRGAPATADFCATCEEWAEIDRRLRAYAAMPLVIDVALSPLGALPGVIDTRG